MLLQGGLRVLCNDVDFVLEDDDVVQLHNLDCSQVLSGLRLRAGLVSRNQEKSGIHHCSASKHSCHQHVVSRAIYEGDVPEQLHLGAAGGAECSVLLVRGIGVEAVWSGTLDALVELGICVTQLDCDVPDLLLEMLDSVYSRDCTHKG